VSGRDLVEEKQGKFFSTGKYDVYEKSSQQDVVREGDCTSPVRVVIAKQQTLENAPQKKTVRGIEDVHS